MAPTTTPATGAGACAVAATATSEGSKFAARSVGLGLPALPPLPGGGLGLASQGQPSSSSCKRLARNVVSMAVGEPSAPLAAGNNEDLTQFASTLKQEWDGIKNKYAVTTVAVALTLGMWSAGAVVSAIDKVPVVPGLMEAVGLGYSGWFVFKNMLFKDDRDSFFKKVKEFYEDLISG